MTIAGTLRRATALCLLALTGALGTGLPSHHHDSPVAQDRTDVSIDADHHSHGSVLVEQSDRVPSSGPQLAVPAIIAVDVISTVVATATRADDEPLRPLERAPPPGAPRAPPHHVV